jgi:phosphate-selective porin
MEGDARLDGFYAQEGWFLTREHRLYLRSVFFRVVPKKNFLEGRGLLHLATCGG